MRYCQGYSRTFHFTLIELLIVLTIVFLILSVVGINITKSIQNERYRTSTNLVIDKLQLAQDLMLILKTDVRVKFVEDADTKKLKCLIDVEKALIPSLKKIVNQNTNIEGIGKVEFEDLDLQGKLRPNNFNLNFESGGTKMSRGYLHLHASNNEAQEEIIYLPGYPKQIGNSSKVKENHKFSLENQNETYPEDSYNVLYPNEIKKIMEENQKKK